MAKLIIYHGDVLEQEVELGEGSARIGRGPDNDIVLADPTRSVSRHHAEVRFDHNQYALVDSNSQNGLWVEGRRVPKVPLVPGVPVVMGSYKVVLKDERPLVEESSDATVIMRAPDLANDATIIRMVPPDAAATIIRRIPAAAPPPAAPKVEAAPIPAAPKVEAPKPAAPPDPKPEPKPAPPVVAEPPRAAPKPPPPAPPPPMPAPPPAAASPAATAKPARKGRSRALVFGGLAALLMAAMAAAVFVSPLNRWTGRLWSKLATMTASSTPAVVPSGRDSQPVVPPAPAPRAVTKPVAVPAATPRVRREIKPPQPTAPAPVAAPPPPPPAAVKETPPDLASMFEQARSAIIKGDYLAAIAGLEAVLKLDANYPNAANLLDVARGGAKNASQLAIDSGNLAEMRADYATAAKQYQRAQQLDPSSTGATDAMRRLKARMQGEGEEVFKRAKAYEATGKKEEAISAYDKALQLLPPDHPSAKIARESLAVLKGGA